MRVARGAGAVRSRSGSGREVPAGGWYPALHDRVHAGELDAGQDGLDAGVGEHRIDEAGYFASRSRMSNLTLTPASSASELRHRFADVPHAGGSWLRRGAAAPGREATATPCPAAPPGAAAAAPSRQPYQQRRQERPALRGELHPHRTKLPLQHRDLVTQSQDLNVLPTISQRQQTQRSERVRDHQVRQTKQHKRSPCPGSPAPHHAPDLCGHGFRHAQGWSARAGRRCDR